VDVLVANLEVTCSVDVAVFVVIPLVAGTLVVGEDLARVVVDARVVVVVEVLTVVVRVVRVVRVAASTYPGFGIIIGIESGRSIAADFFSPGAGGGIRALRRTGTDSTALGFLCTSNSIFPCVSV